MHFCTIARVELVDFPLARLLADLVVRLPRIDYEIVESVVQAKAS